MTRAFAVLALLASCSNRPLDHDLTHAATSTVDAGAICHTHFGQLVPLTSIATLDGTNLFSPTSALRLRASASVASCDGFFSLGYNLETSALPVETLLVLGTAVEDTASCDGTRLLTQVLTVPAQPAVLEEASELVMTDGYPCDIPAHIELQPMPPSSACDPRDDDAICTADCQCVASSGSMCLVGTDGTYRCGVPCVADNDCTMSQQCDTVTRYACVTPPTCRTSCAFGEHLVGCTCIVDAPPQPTVSCTCDADCPSGALCAGTQCVVPCSGAGPCGPTPTNGLPFFCSSGICAQPNP